MKRIINGAFIGLLLVFLVTSLVRTLAFPYEINEYENRKAEQVGQITLAGFLDGSLQEQMEKAFADQALFALCLVFIFSSTYNPFIYFRF